MLTEVGCIPFVSICGSTQNQPTVASFPLLWSAQIYCQAKSGGQGVMVAGIKVAVLPSEVWAASGVLFEQTPTPAAPPEPHLKYPFHP